MSIEARRYNKLLAAFSELQTAHGVRGRLALPKAPESEDVVMDDEKWTHVTVRLKPEERSYLEAAADRNHVSLSAFARSILVDAIDDEREHAKRLAARKSAASATPGAPKDSPSPSRSTAD